MSGSSEQGLTAKAGRCETAAIIECNALTVEELVLSSRRICLWVELKVLQLPSSVQAKHMFHWSATQLGAVILALTNAWLYTLRHWTYQDMIQWWNKSTVRANCCIVVALGRRTCRSLKSCLDATVLDARAISGAQSITKESINHSQKQTPPVLSDLISTRTHQASATVFEWWLQPASILKDTCGSRCLIANAIN